MPTLAAHLLDPARRPGFVAATASLIDDQVNAQRGPSGLALKTAYKVVKGVRPDMVTHAVDALLPQFLTALEPFYAEHLANGVPLPTLLSQRRAEMAEAMLAVTDARAAKTSNSVLRSAYGKVRRSAAKQLAAAAPAVGELLARWTADAGR